MDSASTHGYPVSARFFCIPSPFRAQQAVFLSVDACVSPGVFKVFPLFRVFQPSRVGPWETHGQVVMDSGEVSRCSQAIRVQL